MIRLTKCLILLIAMAFVLGFTTTALADHVVMGKIKNIAADKNEVVVTDENAKDWTFQVAEGAKFVFPERKEGKLADLKVGSEISLLGDEKADQQTASVILLHEGEYRDARLSHGTFKSGAVEDNQVVITDENAKDWTYQVTDTAKILVGEKEARLTDLKASDQVVFVYQKKGERLMLMDLCAKRK